MDSKDLIDRYSIGANIVAESCTEDLNKLLKLINPIARDMPWSYWHRIMQSGSIIVTCFDDKKSCVIGMTTIVPEFRPTGHFANIYDTIILDEYDNLQIKASLILKASDIIKDAGLTLR